MTKNAKIICASGSVGTLECEVNRNLKVEKIWEKIDNSLIEKIWNDKKVNK